MNINIGEQKYCFAIPCYDGSICIETAQALVDTTNRLTQNNVAWNFLANKGNAIIELSRNELTHKFLHETDADVMVCIDGDMSWHWEGMARLLAWSTKYPVAAGIYCSRQDPPKFTINTKKPISLNEFGLLPLNGVGFGFIAIQRKVFEQLEVPSFIKKDVELPMKQFFKNELKGENFYGEDMYFCNLVQTQLGIDVMADPMIELGHHGKKDFLYLFKDYLPGLLEKHNGL